MHKKKGKKAKKISTKKGKEAHAAFFCVDGSAINSIPELAESLDRMSDDTFYYHVGEGRNDFSNWVRDVFGENKLAKEMAEQRTREQNLIAVLKHMLR